MIYTVTLNPSVDYNISLNEFKEGKINLTESSNYHPGGKGINVSQVLKGLGVESVALGFVGGFTGKYIVDELEKKEIVTDFTHIAENTRVNIKMKAGEIESEINGNSPKIGEADINDIFFKLINLSSGDILILSGSVPKCLKANIYREIMASLPKGVKVFLDAKDDALKFGIEQKPYLVKPNHLELESYFNEKFDGIEEIITYGRRLLQEGAQNVVVSMAGEGALLLNNGGVYRASVPQGNVINSVGAGDSVVAGIVAEIERGKSIEEAFVVGVAAGTASAFSEGLCSEEKVNITLSKIKVEKIG